MLRVDLVLSRIRSGWGQKTRDPPWLVVVLLFLLAGLLPPLFYINRPLHVDEAIFLVVGRELQRGATLYVDVIDHKPPAVFVLASALASLPGEQYQLARVTTYATNAATAVLVVLLGSRIRDYRVGVVAGGLFLIGVYLPHFDGFYFLTEPFSIFLMTLAAVLLLDEHRTGDVVAGLALGMAVLFNQTVFLIGLSIVAVYALQYRSHHGDGRSYLLSIARLFSRIGVGFVIPLFAVGAYHLMVGSLESLFHYVIYIPLTTYTTPFSLEGHVLAFVTYLPVWLLAGSAVLAVGYRYLREADVDVGTLLVTLWFLVLVLPGARGFNGDHKLLFAFPPAAILAALALVDLSGALGVDRRQLGTVVGPDTVRAVTAATLVVSVVVMGLSVGGNGMYIYYLADTSVSDQAAAAGQLNETVEGPVYTLPAHQEVVYFGQDIEPARTYLGVVYSEPLARDVIRGLESQNVTYVIVARHVVTDNDTIRGETGFFPEPRGMVAEYVEREYDYLTETDEFVVFRRK